ncbi:MAG: TRAP transporter fused permease subunit, partial [Desulfobacterales bacterium]|nr:TRAP transporter fused permease subunit [Desulfobacterales bacterium]
GFEFGFIVSSLSVGFQGIFGMLLSASATMLFLLVIFGAIFEATGVTAFFMEFGKLLGRLLPGGSGHMAIFSSSFVGMVNGAAPANVAITGSYTIPVMKKAGFRPETAAGIESMASTGGQLTPPIMGIAIFVMAGFLGISYVTLMSKALIPAVAYYAVAVLGVVLIAFREKIPMVTETADRNVILNGAPLFLIPITVLTVIMFKHYSIGYAAFWAIVTLLLVSFARSRSRPRLQILVRNLIDGAFMAATFGIAIGCIGMLIKILTFTGAATKLGLVAGMVSGGNVTLLLVMIMVVSIILGASLPTVIAYIIVAFVAAPVVVEAGGPIVRAHLFVYYFAILSAVTPPIAGAAMVGCKIAGTGYIKSSWESFKLVGPFFLVPFFIINNPLLMSEPQPLVQGVMVIIALIIALVTMTCFCQGYGLVKTNWIEQTALLTSAMLATCFGMYRHTGFFAGSLLLAVWVFFHLWRKYRLSK